MISVEGLTNYLTEKEDFHEDIEPYAGMFLQAYAEGYLREALSDEYEEHELDEAVVRITRVIEGG